MGQICKLCGTRLGHSLSCHKIALLRILDLERQLADVTVERDKALAELAEARNRAKELR